MPTVVGYPNMPPELTPLQLVQLNALLNDISAAAGESRRGVFFSQVNAALSELRGQLGPDVTRQQATAAVQFLRQREAAAEQFQEEIEAGGPPASIPINPNLQPGEFRGTLSGTIIDPLTGEEITLRFGIRTLGVPSEAQIASAVLDQLAAYGESYDIEDIEDFQVNDVVFTTVEMGRVA